MGGANTAATPRHVSQVRRLARSALLIATVIAIAVLLVAGTRGTGAVGRLSDLAQLCAALWAAGCATWAGLVSADRRQRASWFAFGVGAASWAGGQAMWCWAELIRHSHLPIPSVADIGFLLFAVGAGAGLLLLTSHEAGSGRSQSLLDGIAVAGALTVISWAMVLRPLLHSAHTGGLGFGVLLAYPLEDALLVTVAIWSLCRPATHLNRLLMLFTALTLFAVSDSSYAYLTIAGTYRSGGPVDLGWILAFTALAGVATLAALERGPRLRPVPTAMAAAGPERPGPISTMVPYAPALLAVAVLAVRQVQGQSLDGVEAAALLCTGGAALLREWMIVTRDRTLQLQLTADRVTMRAQALRDPLTGLANRALFLNRVEHAIDLHRRDLRPVSVLLCDLHDFKTLNDTFGHVIGDQVLIGVAERLLSCTSPGDTIARLDGDEFAILLEDGSDPANVGSRVIAAIQAPLALTGADAASGAHAARAADAAPGAGVGVRASVGIGQTTPETTTPTVDVLLGQAGTALYAAKQAGTGLLSMFVEGMAMPHVDDLHLREPLSCAIRERRIDVHYQPIVNLVTGEIASLEALSRWTYEGVAMDPEQFIPLAERADLLDDLTDMVLADACGRLARWSRRLGHQRLRVAVNITPGMILEENFSDRIARVLARHRILPGQLILEVTEAALLNDATLTRRGTARLHELGVLLSLDDFGKGYSSLQHVQQIPLDSVKIDQSFVADIDRDPGAERFIAAVLALARELGVTVVAEGVERTGQADVLRRLGCPLGQGYLFSRPLPGGEVDAFLVAAPTAPRTPARRRPTAARISSTRQR